MTESLTNPPEAPLRPESNESDHRVALKAYLMQLETRVRILEDWKDKQPVYAEINGKMEIVPSCFDGEIKPEDLP
jgi:hypothetical protein